MAMARFANWPELPRAFWGLWRRNAIELPAAPADRTTRVFYLQTPRLFLDLRVPATRPSLVGRSALCELSKAQRRSLARQIAFAGYTEKRGRRLIWHHGFDYQLLPDPTRAADEGKIALSGRFMTEWGVHRPYTEQWEKIDDGGGLFLGLESEDPGPKAFFGLVGDHFMLARERSFRARGAAGLGDALDRATGGEAERLLDCEFSYGRRRGGDVSWRVALSTIPMLEGAPRFPVNAWRVDGAARRVMGPFGADLAPRRWRIVDCTVAYGRLGAVLNGH